MTQPPIASPLRLGLEPGYDGGRCGAWLLDLPGAFGWAAMRDAAISQSLSVAGWWRDWLARHGEAWSLGWLGSPGRGRALGVGEVKFSDQVLPSVKNVLYGVDLKRVFRSKLVLGVADGWLEADGRRIYEAKDLRVGLFQQAAAAPA